ncbi:FCD domain-containing protein [Pseudonocardia parietis]|uniref:DNA-binding FadR family transcriptional regulator n=1 Tax=Pseudonocardia parietis TaxID=570936 RepID=A0ABS4VV03_9PSEU|nr:FCD domain-containing protein [Pseudonocardia parietis]MBP2367742.1 DNA-binding FadR family transcriptional regulator [Pseudonocardia parietis]
MDTARQPERRFPLAGNLYRGLQNAPDVPADDDGPARIGLRTAAALESGTITLHDAADRLESAGLGMRGDDADTAPPPTLDQITAARLVLEPAVAAGAARAVTPDTREPLLRHASVLGAVAGIEPDPRRLFRHDCEGHGALYRVASDAAAPAALPGLCRLAHHGWASRAADPHDLLPALRAHLAELAEVLRAVAHGRPERARELATAHVWGTHLMLMQAGADLPR